MQQYFVYCKKLRQRDRNLRKEPQFNCAVLPPKKEVNPMDIQVNDILTMKKQHPCGSKQWQVLRIGMDFKLKCLGCGHEVMLPRSKAEKNIRSVRREESFDDAAAVPAKNFGGK